MQYVNKKTLEESYRRQPKGKAVGIDEMTKEKYGERLEENIDDLMARMKRFAYRPYPVRRTYIPKMNGKMRGLGIPSFEDKMVQGVFKEILEAIYEPKFKEFSFGFRPGKNCHDAIQRINKHIMADKINYVVDADIKGFFDNIDQEWMIKFLEHDIADKNFIRYIKRFLIGGVMEDGKKLETDKGTVQGGLISPVLANVYLHYVLDMWFEYVKKREFKGEMYMVRYKERGTTKLRTHQRGRKRLITPEDNKRIKDMINKNNDITIHEINETLHLNVNDETVRQHVVKMGFRYKKKSIYASERGRSRCKGEKK
jgi:group II intron reverse transcriptase/maturase